MGPWTGRGADVSAVLDLMIHDLDLMHQMIPGGVAEVQARAHAEMGRLADEVQAHGDLPERLGRPASRPARIAVNRRRGMRAVYHDGVVEFDFLTRKMRTLGESVAASSRP